MNNEEKKVKAAEDAKKKVKTEALDGVKLTDEQMALVSGGDPGWTTKSEFDEPGGTIVH